MADSSAEEVVGCWDLFTLAAVTGACGMWLYRHLRRLPTAVDPSAGRSSCRAVPGAVAVAATEPPLIASTPPAAPPSSPPAAAAAPSSPPAAVPEEAPLVSPAPPAAADPPAPRRDELEQGIYCGVGGAVGVTIRLGVEVTPSSVMHVHVCSFSRYTIWGVPYHLAPPGPSGARTMVYGPELMQGLAGTVVTNITLRATGRPGSLHVVVTVKPMRWAPELSIDVDCSIGNPAWGVADVLQSESGRPGDWPYSAAPAAAAPAAQPRAVGGDPRSPPSEAATVGRRSSGSGRRRVRLSSAGFRPAPARPVAPRGPRLRLRSADFVAVHSQIA